METMGLHIGAGVDGMATSPTAIYADLAGSAMELMEYPPVPATAHVAIEHDFEGEES